MNRRELLKVLGLGAITAASLPLLQACAPAAPAAQKPAEPAKPAEAAKPADAAKPAEAAKPAAQTAAGTPSAAASITVVVQNDWVTFDPPFNTAEPGGSNMIYGEWINWKADASGAWGPKPDLVAEWESKPDLLTFKLQKGVKFHDGTRLGRQGGQVEPRPADLPPLVGPALQPARHRRVQGGRRRARQDEGRPRPDRSPSARRRSRSSTTRRSRSASRRRIRRSSTSSTGPGAAPVSPTAYNTAGKDAFGRKPVGAGPFRFVEWQSGSHVVLEKNPEYWKKGADGQPLPYLDKLTYRLIIDDSVRLLELKSGNAHFTELIQGKDIAGIKTEPTLTVVESQVSGNNYRVIFDSTNPESPFRNLKLRQAMLYALDREAMAKTLGFASGISRKYLLPKGSLAYDETEKVPFYAFDKAKAEALVKEAIAEDKSLAGPDGKVAITFSVIDRAVDKAQSEMIKQMAEQVGFSVTLETLERAAWTAKLVKRPGQPGGKFDMASMRNPVTADDPDGQWRTFFHSTGRFNVAHIEDKEWDKLIDEAGASFDDAKRKQMYIDLEKKAFEQAWYGWLWQQNWNWVFNKKLTNFQEPVTNRWDFTETWMA